MENIGEVTIDLMEHSVKIIVDDKIIDKDTLKWRHESNGSIVLTLNEISEQINTEDIIYVWIESGLSGAIYMFGNYEDKMWCKHGTTRGFA